MVLRAVPDAGGPSAWLPRSTPGHLATLVYAAPVRRTVDACQNYLSATAPASLNERGGPSRGAHALILNVYFQLLLTIKVFPDAF
jgi:hypothetical protein